MNKHTPDCGINRNSIDECDCYLGKIRELEAKLNIARAALMTIQFARAHYVESGEMWKDVGVALGESEYKPFEKVEPI